MKIKNSKVTIGKTYFKSKHYLQIEAVLEFSDKGYPSDIVFLSIFEDQEDFKTSSKRIDMQIHSTDLRDLCEAAREIIACKCTKIQYKKMTKKHDGLKTIDLKASSSEIDVENDENGTKKAFLWKYHVNIRQGDKTISVSFDKYGIRTFIKKIEHLAETLETSLYAAQKQMSIVKIKEAAAKTNMNPNQEG